MPHIKLFLFSVALVLVMCHIKLILYGVTLGLGIWAAYQYLEKEWVICAAYGQLRKAEEGRKAEAREVEQRSYRNPCNNHDYYTAGTVNYSNPRNNHYHVKRKYAPQGLLHDHGTVNYSNPHNNHDHVKRKYTSREEAEYMVGRMKKYKCVGSERLKVYYNREHGGWYIGRGWE